MMARRGRGAGSGGKYALGVLGAVLCAFIGVVVLITTGGWQIVSTTAGVGNADASVADVSSADRRKMEREPNAKTPQEWLNTLLGGASSTTGQHVDQKKILDTIPKTTTPPETSEPAQNQSQPEQTPSLVSPEIQTAITNLAAIPTAKPDTSGYNRDRYFGTWQHADSMCGKATTRDLILARDLKNVTFNKDCHIQSGTLADPYTGRTIEFKRGPKTSADVQIDHVVALQDAWGSGAKHWSQNKRTQYANSPDVLLAVDGKQNMGKGSGLLPKVGTPWLPANKNYWCTYAAKRVQIKHDWGLTMSPQEKTATGTLLAGCVAQ